MLAAEAKPKFSTDAARWQAVQARDPQADGCFVYAVRTTGVYCHPSCPSRGALRRNVEFFDTTDLAAKAGYRACKRCGPDARSPAKAHRDAVTLACRLIDDAETPPRLNDLAAQVGMSPHHFHRIFKQATGVTPKAYATARRTSRMKAQLHAGSDVTTALYDAGYNASSRFYEDAKSRLGMTPASFGKGGAGATIHFAVGETSLGCVLVAATPHGVCAIELGDDPDELVKSLQDRFHKAELVGADKGFEKLVAQICGHVETPTTALTLPLDVLGTAFQHKVWAALQAIPTGQTASYADIARAIGEPKSARAIARACASNPVAMAIPCHRVVRTDGALSGYRWGVERKRSLLDREAATQK